MKALRGVLAERKFDVQLHLLDDGFQHRQLHRDFDIVLVPAADIADSLLPLGRLREPIRALLDFPQYTPPADYRGWRVPETLISGNHREVAKWRERKALEKTRRNRPDLLRTVIEE